MVYLQTDSMTQFEIMMDEGFDLITKESFPSELEEVQRLELLQCFIQHFMKLEEYEKCQILKDRMETVMFPVKRKRKKKSTNI